ncbi:MAG: LacI family transcriptional regulator [Propionibacteriaceae bacterium]|jgi:LacI family transcriptional regulator|nr:LacI family transcriptional regulator [Propionibacteriaceae bacterium]
MITIRDIAREAGVSVSTVSRVLSGKPDVSQATAVRVQAVIDHHAFEANRNARFLKQADTSTILVVVKGRHNLLFASMVESVQAAITEAGLSTAVSYIDEDGDEVAHAERLVPELKPQGTILLGVDAGHLMRSGKRVGVSLPTVLLTNVVRSSTHPLVSSVATDDVASGAEAITYLVSRGHRDIGVVGGDPVTSAISANRLDGARRGLSDQGLSLEDRWVATRFSMSSGHEATTALLSAHPELTAIYAMSDIMALGALRALHDLGLRAPGDVSVIGHDGVELASYVVPSLVTLRQPQDQMARRGVDILLALIAGGEAVHEVLPVELVPGESVRDWR